MSARDGSLLLYCLGIRPSGGPERPSAEADGVGLGRDPSPGGRERRHAAALPSTEDDRSRSAAAASGRWITSGMRPFAAPPRACRSAVSWRRSSQALRRHGIAVDRAQGCAPGAGRLRELRPPDDVRPRRHGQAGRSRPGGRGPGRTGLRARSTTAWKRSTTPGTITSVPWPGPEGIRIEIHWNIARPDGPFADRPGRAVGAGPARLDRRGRGTGPVSRRPHSAPVPARVLHPQVPGRPAHVLGHPRGGPPLSGRDRLGPARAARAAVEDRQVRLPDPPARPRASRRRISRSRCIAALEPPDFSPDVLAWARTCIFLAGERRVGVAFDGQAVDVSAAQGEVQSATRASCIRLARRWPASTRPRPIRVRIYLYYPLRWADILLRYGRHAWGLWRGDHTPATSFAPYPSASPSRTGFVG